MPNLPPLSSEGKENLSHIVSDKIATPTKASKIKTSAEEVLKTPAANGRVLPERPVQIDEASLIKRWKEGGNWCKTEEESLQTLKKYPKLCFTIWSSIPTSWSVALSPGESLRVSKGLTDPVASARAMAIRDNHALFIADSQIAQARNAMLGINSASFFLSDTSNPNEFTLELMLSGQPKPSSFTLLCTESGYEIRGAKEPVTFTSLDALLDKLGVNREHSLYNSLYHTMKIEFDFIGYQNISYLKKLEPFVQNVALDVISDTVQDKDAMKSLIARLATE